VHKMAQTFHKFRAATFDEAYRMVLRTLGEDAVVINSAEVSEGGFLGFGARKVVEITAASSAQTISAMQRKASLIEKKYAEQGKNRASDGAVNETVEYFRQIVAEAQLRAAREKQQAPPPRTDPQAREKNGAMLRFPRADEEFQETDRLEREIKEMRAMLKNLSRETPETGIPPEFLPHFHALIEKGVPRSSAIPLVNAVIRESDPGVLRNPRVFKERLRMEIHKRVEVTRGIHLTQGRRHLVALVGATGVGKTTNIAKLAAEFAVREGANVGLITMDTYRVAAPEQLRVYANIMGLPMCITNDPAELTYAINEFRDCDLVLMDTAGGSQFNRDQIYELKGLLDVARPDEVILVLPANMQVEELRSVVESFRCTNPTSLMFSKLDETRRYGALYGVATETGLPISYFSTGQNVPDDIELATPSKTAKLLLEDADARVGSSAQSS
jgi:flagellar biosynthesis protein FlhF